MQISEKRNGTQSEVSLQGRLDAITYKELEQNLSACLEAGVTSLTLDLAGLEYISSAGLRVMLWAKKKIAEKNGRIALRAPRPQVKGVFDMAGLTSFFELIP